RDAILADDQGATLDGMSAAFAQAGGAVIGGLFFVFIDYAREVQERLVEKGLRIEVDDSANSMQKKIRENARQKIPYLLIGGDREAEQGTVNVRRRGEKQQEALDVEEFAERVLREVASREENLVDTGGGRGV